VIGESSQPRLSLTNLSAPTASGLTYASAAIACPAGVTVSVAVIRMLNVSLTPAPPLGQKRHEAGSAPSVSGNRTSLSAALHRENAAYTVGIRTRDSDDRPLVTGIHPL
jgi:hypothetical protein